MTSLLLWDSPTLAQSKPLREVLEQKYLKQGDGQNKQ